VSECLDGRRRTEDGGGGGGMCNRINRFKESLNKQLIYSITDYVSEGLFCITHEILLRQLRDVFPGKGLYKKVPLTSPFRR
jgi:hypothetical protein